MSISLTLKNWLFDSSDEALMERFAQSSDNKLLVQLYDNCADNLYHFLLTQSDPAMAKDISQRTWLTVIEKKHLYRRNGRFQSWLFTLGRNHLIDELRKHNRLSSLDDPDLQVAAQEQADFENTSLSEAFDRVLMQLPFVQREAFCLQQEGFGLQEIASITYSETETVKSRIRYAKRTLRDRLEKYHD